MHVWNLFLSRKCADKAKLNSGLMVMEEKVFDGDSQIVVYHTMVLAAGTVSLAASLICCSSYCCMPYAIQQYWHARLSGMNLVILSFA